jgi:HTH-type transcriptional regulator / antitoxin HipB
LHINRNNNSVLRHKTMDYLQTLGRQITRNREKLGVTQTDLAAIVGLSDKTVRAIEHGKNSVSIKNWMTVADAVGLVLQLSTKNKMNETR